MNHSCNRNLFCGRLLTVTSSDRCPLAIVTTSQLHGVRRSSRFEQKINWYRFISFHDHFDLLWSPMISYDQWRFMTFSGFVLSCFINLAVFPFSIPHWVRQPVWKSTGFTMLQALLWTIVQLKRLSLTAGIAMYCSAWRKCGVLKTSICRICSTSICI